jgi:diguanylate cyclase (GGDEF)-like protein/PAS domain S-box-containing protein
MLPHSESPLSHVLYVEDNPVDADLVRRALAKTMPSIQVHVAGSLHEGQAYLAGPCRPQVVLCDLNLPDGYGLDLLNHLRENAMECAFVILTGCGDQQAAVAALKGGADDYLVKDGDFLERLPRTLEAAWMHAQQESEHRSKPLRVLYAEHHSFDGDLTLRHLAQSAPYLRLDVVSSGHEVLQRLPSSSEASLTYDVLLLDYFLPGFNALDLTKILRQERGLDIPIVMVTGHGNEEIAAQAIRLGVSDYLVKHTGYLHELPIAIDNAYRQAQLSRERQTLRQMSDRLHAVLSLSPCINYALSFQKGSFYPIWVSDNIERIAGYPTDQVLKPDWWMTGLHPEDRQRVIRGFSTLKPNGQMTQEYRFRKPDGEYFWIRDEVRINSDNRTGHISASGIWSDITEQREAVERLHLNNAIIEATHDGIILTDLCARIISVNGAFTRITGYTLDEVRGQTPRILSSGKHDRPFFQALWRLLSEQGSWQGEIWNRRKNGEIYPEWLTLNTVSDPNGTPTHYVGIFTDISHLRQTEDQLDFLYHHDALTALPNRVLMLSRLEHAIEVALPKKQKIAVLIVDLDRFKNINDSLGHPVGDELLILVGQRLLTALPEGSSLGRLGGDEFMLLVDRLDQAESAMLVANRLLGVFETPFSLSQEAEVFVRASIGISLFPNDGQTAHDLVRNADAAVYRAKDAGRNTCCFYTEELTRFAGERLLLETRLRRAIGQHEFVVFYQPVLCVQTGRLLGAEALVRWQPPGERMVPPAAFIPIAEETGLIVDLGEWVLREACTQVQRWKRRALPFGKLAVNLSPEQFRRQDVCAMVARVLDETGFLADDLELEITESGLMEQGDQAEARLKALKGLGVSLAIDDFGTGYSSLAYLKRFAIDKLKIDRSFVKDIAEDRNDLAIANAIMALAFSLEMCVQAEGVENEEQLHILRAQGCQTYQGYLCSPPLPASDFEARFLL